MVADGTEDTNCYTQLKAEQQQLYMSTDVCLSHQPIATKSVHSVRMNDLCCQGAVLCFQQAGKNQTYIKLKTKLFSHL